MIETDDEASAQPASPALAFPQFLVVGIGASAGGIKALQAFFEHVAPDSGFAYVVILHLSPEHESRLAAVLQTVARIPVQQVPGSVSVFLMFDPARNRMEMVPIIGRDQSSVKDPRVRGVPTAPPTAVGPTVPA